jgi:CRP-like cAMP-binding protein
VLTALERGFTTLVPVVAEDAMRVHPFASDLDAVHMTSLTACAHPRSFETGEFLWRQGELASDLYLICSGNVSLQISIPHQGSIEIDALGPGEVVGWSWLAPYHRWHVDARATTPVLAFQLDGKALLETMERNHDFGYEVLKRLALVMARRLQATRSRVYQLSSQPAKEACGK